jgi:hypothetical protein
MPESTKLWSEICEEVDDSPEDKTAYQFSNGRKLEAADTQGA